jgi:hypothetical protein
MKSLWFKAKYQDAILSGEKTETIRWILRWLKFFQIAALRISWYNVKR